MWKYKVIIPMLMDLPWTLTWHMNLQDNYVEKILKTLCITLIAHENTSTVQLDSMW